MGDEIASFYATISADSSAFKRGLLEASVGMAALSDSTSALKGIILTTFAVGATIVGGFVATIFKSVGAAADMEQGVADIGATMGTTNSETEALRKNIMDLGLDPKLKVSATQASEAVMALGQAGLTATQIMGGASKATVLLANATGANFGEAANIATDVMQQFNITAGDMMGAVNQITGATIQSKFNIDDYRLAIAQAGGVAGALGVPFADFNATIATTASSFASGSDAGTSYKVFLQRLMPVSDKAAEYMNKIGLSTAGAGSAFFDTSGKMKSMSEIAGLLQGAFGKLSDAEKDEAASHIFGTDAMRTALALAKAGPEVIDRMKASIGNTNAEESAAKRMDTFKGSIEIAQGVIETISIAIGDKFLPVLRPLITTFTTLATTQGPAIISFFGQLADKMNFGVSAVQQWGSGTDLLWKNLKNIYDTITGVVETIQAVINTVGTVANKFGLWKDVLYATGVVLGAIALPVLIAVVGAMWPLISAVAQVTVLVAELRLAWEHNFFGIRTVAEDTFTKLRKWFDETGIWKGSWKDTLYGAGGIQPTLITWSLYTQNLINAWVQYGKDKFEGWKNDVVQTFTIWKDWIVSTWDEWTGPTIHKVEVWATDVRGKFQNFIGWVVKDFNSWRDWLVDHVFAPILQWWNDHITPMVNIGRNMIQGLWDGVRSMWGQFTNWLNTAWEGIKSKVQAVFQMHSPSKVFAGYGENMMKGMAGGIKRSKDAVYAALDGLSADVATNATANYSNEYTYVPAAGNSASADTVLMQRNNQLLETLIAELRGKNMTANVTVAGGGGNLGSLVSLTNGLRH